MKVVIDVTETYYALCKVCVGLHSETVDQHIIADGIPYDEFCLSQELKNGKTI